MSDGVFKTDNTLITDHIRDEIPNKEAFQIVNRLLDGSWTMQTIGQPASEMNLTVYGDLTAVNALNQIQGAGIEIKIVSRGASRKGVIDGQVAWSESAPGYYQGNMRVLVTEE